MTDASLEQTFDGVIAGRGELTAFQADVARIIAQLLLSSKSMTDAGELTALASDVAKLEALLPPVAAPDDTFEIRRLSDEELSQLHALQLKGCASDAPIWTPPEPVEPELGESERIGRNLGAWIDERKEAWRFGGCSALEANHLRGELGSLVFPLIARNLWADIHRADLESKIEQG